MPLTINIGSKDLIGYKVKGPGRKKYNPSFDTNEKLRPTEKRGLPVIRQK